MAPTRAETKLLKFLSQYDVLKDMVSRAVDPVNPSLIKSLPKNRDKLENAFADLTFEWKSYKADLEISVEEFNAVGENDVPNYMYNDLWYEGIKTAYYELIDSSDEKLDSVSADVSDSTGAKLVNSNSEEQKALQDQRQIESLCGQITTLSESITNAIENIRKEVVSLPDGSQSEIRVRSLKSDLADLDNKMDDSLNKVYYQYISLLSESEVKEKEAMRKEFIQREKLNISNILIKLSKKLKETSTVTTSPSAYSVEKGSTYLKKADPPKWEGDPLDFADFKRKWLNQVSTAKMPPETELDRLRENIPIRASKSLFGETQMDKAWAILENLYGDKDLITNKLKKQLKAIKVKGKQDYDVLIDLVTDVKNIVLRLTAVGAEQILHVDNEFLGAVFRALPVTSQSKWLDFDKSMYETKWTALMKFLEVAREQALQTKVLMMGYDQTDFSGSCHKCGKSGHKGKNCSDIKVNNTRASGVQGDKINLKDEKKQAKENVGKCPLCKGRHTYTRLKDKQDWPSDRLFKCDDFKKMSIQERANTLQRLSACPKCTSWNHVKNDCPSQAKCGMILNGVRCNGDHSSMVCGSGNAYCGAVKSRLISPSCTESSDSDSSLSSRSDVSSNSSVCSSSSISSSGGCSQVNSNSNFPDIHAETLLLFQDVPIVGAKRLSTTCWDNGSNRCLVTHSFARACNMRRHDIVLKLDVVGNHSGVQNSCYYIFEMVKNDGSIVKVWAYGLDSIMGPSDSVDLTGIRHLFPHISSEVFSARPSKEVDILMGNNFLSLHPNGGTGRDVVGDLIAFQSSFGSGWVIGGTHPCIQISSSKLSAHAANLARVNRCMVSPELPNFWDAECLGVQSPRRCGRCLRCKDCSDPALVHSRKDQEDLDMIKEGVKLENGKLQVSYYFSRDPNCLPNNRANVIKMAERQERRLLKTGQHENYSKEIQKYIDRGGAVRLSKEELDNWCGPINYVSHHGVVQDSATTPLRVVTNSSLNNGGRSLNDCLPTGPNSMNPMLDIMLRFRCHEAVLLFDLTKAYNALHTGPIERHLRRFVYRFDPTSNWEDFAFDRVVFGDNPAANLLEIGRNMTADAGKHIDPAAATKLKRDSYVDDCLTGGSYADVARMKGKLCDDGKFDGTMQRILDKGGLRAKVFVSSGDADEAMKSLIGNKALGYHWNATSDQMAVLFPVYLTNKRKKPRLQPALASDTLDLLNSTVFTKRLCLGITNGILDFLGIACPFLLRFKLLMRQLFETQHNQLSWESRIPDDMVCSWKELIIEAVQTECIFFPRSVRPENAVGKPLIVGFSDGAFPAFGACIYIQWQYQQNNEESVCNYEFDASLLLAKARVTPLSGYTIPRSELAGALLLSRLCLTVAKALSSDATLYPDGVVPLSDSKCTISALDTTTRVLKPFFHNKVAEILDNFAEAKKYCSVEDLHYVSSSVNPADLATRGSVSAKEIGPDSFWQKGPAFLRSRRDFWPVTRDFTVTELPDEEVRIPRKSSWTAYMRGYASKSTAPGLPKLWCAIVEVLNYSDSISKVLGILARLIIGWRLKAQNITVLENSLRNVSPEDLCAAERLLLLSAMPETATAYHDGKLLSLAPRKDGNLIVSQGRIGEKSLSRLLGVPHLPILMPSSRAAYLYMVQAHRGEYGDAHYSVAETLARSRLRVWIVRGRDLAKRVCSGCNLCRRNNKVLATQQMALLKEESLTVCRPFSYVSLDYAGPIVVKGAVNARAKMKCWMLIYCCRSTKAVEILPTCGYSTSDFLLRHEEFCARRGAPDTIVSDRGTQLVSAGLVLSKKNDEAAANAPGTWNWSEITQKNRASNWSFVPIGSPHFNGLPESTVKLLKRTLKLTLAPGAELTYPELQTLLAKISYTVNSRPLGLSSISQTSNQEDIMMPLTPNMLLLGRSSNLSPSMTYSKDDRFSSRLAYVAQVEQEWWDRWMKGVLPTLFSYKRWKSKKENLSKGDIVMLRYPKHFKDDYCLAKVTDVHPDEDGLIRKVSISYRRRNPKESADVYRSKPLITEEVAIHRLYKLDVADENSLISGEAGKAEEALSD